MAFILINMKLISMTDFVLETFNNTLTKDFQAKVYNYANFLKMPLKLSMFVVLDKQGNVFNKPKVEDYNEETNGYFNAINEFADQSENVLFKGFEIYGNGDLYNQFVTFDSDRLEIMTVENLITDFQYSFYLTDMAVKRIFG